MRVALISTVFNEADSIPGWAQALQAQTRIPDEFVVVDGGSADGTPEILARSFQEGRFPRPKLMVERCNIAEGRNRAIRETTAEIIVSTDAGSFPESRWLEELVKPFSEDPAVDIVGGRTHAICETPFQKFLRTFEPPHDTPRAENAVFSSSRNVAFRRDAWSAVGGYPEWLTLAGEDALFNYELHALGMKFVPNMNASVHWPERPDAHDYFRLLYRNAFGAAEAQLYTTHFRRQILITLCPLLLLFSQHRFDHLLFRYRKNLSGALGWLAGKLTGHRPPPGWRHEKGVLLSPEAQTYLRQPHD